MLTNTIETLNAIKEMTIKISNTKSGECIHQTQRNQIGAMLRSALIKDLAEIFPPSENADAIVAYHTKDGLVLEIPNSSVADNMTNTCGSGAITVNLDYIVKSLEYNAKDESEAYEIDLADKIAKERKKAEDKVKKVEQDKKLREKKKKGQKYPFFVAKKIVVGWTTIKFFKNFQKTIDFF